MNRQDLVCGILSLMLEDVELLKKKNLDYSPGDDALANFRDFGVSGIITRMGDKYMRLKTFILKGTYTISSESFEDTLSDMCIYGYLARIISKDNRNGK